MKINRFLIQRNYVLMQTEVLHIAIKKYVNGKWFLAESYEIVHKDILLV